jgi:polyphosphate kinase 2 (PPK2 family)
LEEADLSARMSRDEEAKRLRKAQLRVLHLRLINGGQLSGGRWGPPVCIIFEGWDAAGKGGAIKRLVEPLDPRHVHVAPFAAPTPDELRHHFLWRFWPPLPGWGGMTIFDRSWYGRVLVERVENLATEAQWRRAYDEISDFEHSLAEEGMVVIKLWLHMSHEEQLRRFERRRDDPLKSWKLTAEDWRNREKRPQYDEAVSDMLRLTSGRLAPWDVISAENKRNGRVEVIETVIRRMEEGMARWGIEVPSADDEEEERTQAALAFDDAEFQPDPEVEAPAEAPGPVAAGAPVAATVPAAPAPAPAAAPAPVPAAAPVAAGAPVAAVPAPAAAPAASPVAAPVAAPAAAPAAAGANGNYAASPAPSPAPAPAPPATTPRTRLDG